MTQVPAGWYPDPDVGGRAQRYWDGEHWTEHGAEPEPPPPVSMEVRQATQARRNRKAKRIVVGVFLASL